ncbi:unnamed protein product [Paramecium octaurelia]|uniref:DUF1343 domain-containing protein n=1 Tax=Paramecium octaurelia TaxID=43137 RepID=A0A8S1UAJ0_PAROT|nr:unnamed protein product [Paramecium octaurelia]
MFIFLLPLLGYGFISLQLNNLLMETKGKRLGLITNPTGVDDDLVMVTDKISKYSDIKKFFSPEHGLRGEQQAGVQIKDYIDPVTGIQVISLYGSKRAPTLTDLEDVDVLVYYIRDVGTRFYTYIWTMTYCMEAAQKAGIQFVVVDVPNPLGRKIEGCRNEMDAGLVGRKFGSNLGLPQRYGLTVGELATFINKEWLTNPVNLKIIPYLTNQFQWILPSPNMPTIETATVYPGFGIFEGTDLSEGRGTTHPFEIIGSPLITKPEELAKTLNARKLTSVLFRPVYFSPTFSKHKDAICGGVQIHVLDKNSFNPVLTAFVTLDEIYKVIPIKFNLMIDYETGISGFAELLKNTTAEKIYSQCQNNTKAFYDQVQRYYLY